MSKHKPVNDRITALFDTVCKEYRDAALGGAGEMAVGQELKKAAYQFDRKVSDWKKKLADLLKVVQPVLFSAEEAVPSEGEVVANLPSGNYTGRVRISGGVLQELSVFFPDGTPIELFEYELIDEDVDVTTEDPDFQLEDASNVGPGELIVAIRQANRKNVRTSNIARIETLLERKADETDAKSLKDTTPGKDGEVLCDLLIFRFDDHMNAQAAADMLDSCNLPFVNGTLVDAIKDEVPDSKIEMCVEAPPLSPAELVNFVADLEACLDMKSAETVTDSEGSSIYFDFTTLKEANFQKSVLESAELQDVSAIDINDPMENRLSEDELQRLDLRPRSLALFVSEGPADGDTTMCSRCVAVGHAGGLLEASNPCGSECDFCGWTPA